MVKIIDYKAGNAQSVFHAVSHLNHAVELVRKPEDLIGADCIILPGVGTSKATMESLQEMNIITALEDAVIDKKVPFLGICIGMQILFDLSEEDNTKCLGWLPGKVVKYDKNAVRVPQMGWNKVKFVKDTKIFDQEDYFYFVNSYHACAQFSDIWGEAEYNGKFTAAVQRENIYGTQFHIEKSGEAGLELLDKIIRWG